jgi:hypothetical protein
MIYNGYVVMQRRKYICTIVQLNFRMMKIPFLFFTGKSNTNKQNTKRAHELQNMAVYVALIIKTKNNNDS